MSGRTARALALASLRTNFPGYALGLAPADYRGQKVLLHTGGLPVARWDDRELRADAFGTVALNPDGSIDQAKMRAVSSSTDFSFDLHDLLLKPVR